MAFSMASIHAVVVLLLAVEKLSLANMASRYWRLYVLRSSRGSPSQIWSVSACSLAFCELKRQLV